MIPKYFSILVTVTLAQVAMATTYPYCKTGMFIPNNENCAKYEFNTNPIEPDITITNGTTFYDISALPPGSLDKHTERMALLITNVFENGDTVMGYASCAAIGDPRGFTAGTIGFTTGTNDAYRLISNYTATYPNNSLAQYLSELKRLSNLPFSDLTGRNDTSGLPNYCKNFKKVACTQEEFDMLQLAMGHDMYTMPAMRFAAMAGVTSNLGKAIFYDTIINHGWQYTEPKINIWRIINLTGPRKTGESEQSYLTRFLNTRRQLMCCWPDDTWPPAADRTVDLQSLVNNWSKNQKLTSPVTLNIYGVTVKGTESVYYDSHNCKTPPPKPTAVPSASTTVPAPTAATCSSNCTGSNQIQGPNSNSTNTNSSQTSQASSLVGVDGPGKWMVVIISIWLAHTLSYSM